MSDKQRKVTSEFEEHGILEAPESVAKFLFEKISAGAGAVTCPCCGTLLDVKSEPKSFSIACPCGWGLEGSEEPSQLY